MSITPSKQNVQINVGSCVIQLSGEEMFVIEHVDVADQFTRIECSLATSILPMLMC